MKRELLFASALLAACVPASEEAPPAGAAGFDTAPSPETQGTMFETFDDWEITVDRLVMQLSVSAMTLTQNEYGSYGGQEPWLFDAKSPTRIFARAVAIGPARVSYQLYGQYFFDFGDSDRHRSSFDNVSVVGVDADTAARFEPTRHSDTPGSYQLGPTMLIVLRARDMATGRFVTLDALLSLSELASSSQKYPPEDEDVGPTVEIRDDDIAAVPLPLRVERLFPHFGDFAAADADGNGVVTASELESAELIEQLERSLPSFFDKE